MSRFLTKKVSPARRWNPKGAINVRSSSPRKLYSTFADQLGQKAHSMPAPTSQPLLRLVEAVTDAPVVRLVTVKSSWPTQLSASIKASRPPLRDGAIHDGPGPMPHIQGRIDLCGPYLHPKIPLATRGRSVDQVKF